jgi:hypothetical protein
MNAFLHVFKSLSFNGMLAGVLLVSAFLLVSCKSDGDRRDIRDYYFPVKELTDGLVYEYRPVGNDAMAPAYWYYRSLIFEDSVFLTGTYYEYNLLPLQFTREEMVSNGMLLEEMYLYEQDSTGKQVRTEVDIVAGNVFPFEVRDPGGIFLYRVEWESPLDPGARTTLIKNRRYLGDTTFIYKEKTYDAVRFEVRELLEYDKEGVFEKEYAGTEIYAEGLGLVYYRKEISPDLTLEYALADRYPMERLEELFLERNPEEGGR